MSKVGINNNALQVDENGYMYPIKWDDVMPAGNWEPASGGTAPDIATHTVGGIAMNFRAFDGNATEESMANSFEILHGIAIELLNDSTNKQDIHIHAMASTTGSGVAKVFFDMVYLPVNGAPISMGTYSTLITINANEQYYHKLGYVLITKPSSGYNIGDKIQVRLRRTPTDAQDTYAGDLLFLQCAMHFPFKSTGSNMPYMQ